MSEHKKGCGKDIIVNKGNYSVKLSLKCGDYNIANHNFVYCDECKNKEDEE